MIKFVSDRFGEMEVNEERIINFEDGIPGFEDSKRFILLGSARPEFYWLQSLDMPNIALPCMNPNLLVENYSPDVSEEVIAKIDTENPEDLIIVNVVRIPEDFKDATINLAAPIIINSKSKKAIQVVLEDTEYEVRYRVFE